MLDEACGAAKDGERGEAGAGKGGKLVLSAVQMLTASSSATHSFSGKLKFVFYSFIQSSATRRGHLPLATDSSL